ACVTKRAPQFRAREAEKPPPPLLTCARGAHRSAASDLPEPKTGRRYMANTPQSKKRARQSVRRQDVNKARRSRIRTFLRKVEEAIASGNQETATAALKAAQPELARGVTKGILHKNTLARKMSRLTSRVKAITARSRNQP